MTDDKHPESRLRILDPSVGVADEAAAVRRDALLARIVATDPGPGNTARKPRRTSGPILRPGRLALGLAAAAVAATATITLWPDGPGGGGAAFASWTAAPTAVAGAELDEIAAACEKAFADFDHLATGEIGHPFLAERRGDYVAVLFRQANPDMSSSCVAEAPIGGAIDAVAIGMTGGSGPMPVPPAGRISDAAISQFQMSGDIASFAGGAVGEGVVGVTIHSDGHTVEATIKDGQYAAWWPGRAVADFEAPSGEEPDIVVLLRFDVTMADGTVLTDVDPALPR